MTFDTVIAGILSVFTNPAGLLWVLLGVAVGLIFGALPGLSATMGVALIIPLTFSMGEVTAIGTLIGVYIGGIAGGAISAILINIPGTPSSVVTSLDGYPMTRNGQAARALGWATFSSGWGSIISWLLLIGVRDSSLIRHFPNIYDAAEDLLIFWQ